MATATQTEVTECACGKPLHYTDENARDYATRMTKMLGEYVQVTVGDKRYMVQRHYLALHGLKAVECEELLAKGILRAG